MKQENVISLYNALSAKVASVPTLDNESYVRTYAILNSAKYARKEAAAFGGVAKILRAGGQGARRIFNSTKRFNKDVFNAGGSDGFPLTLRRRVGRERICRGWGS